MELEELLLEVGDDGIREEDELEACGRLEKVQAVGGGGERMEVGRCFGRGGGVHLAEPLEREEQSKEQLLLVSWVLTCFHPVPFHISQTIPVSSKQEKGIDRH